MDKHIPKLKVGATILAWCWGTSYLYSTPDSVATLKLGRHLKFFTARKKINDLVCQKNSFDDDEYCGLNRKNAGLTLSQLLIALESQNLFTSVVFYKSNLLDQSELFNTFFYDHFSNASAYDIEIAYSRSQNFVIDFNQTRLYEILKNINSNKAMGPDKMRDKVSV